MRDFYKLVLIVFTVFPIISNAQVYIDSVRFVPVVPTCTTNTIVEVYGYKTSGSYIYNNDALSISGSTISYDIYYTSGIGIPVITPITHVKTIGMVGGTFSVEVKIYIGGNLSATSTKSLIVPISGSVSFDVKDSILCHDDSIILTSTSVGTVNPRWYQGGTQVGTGLTYTALGVGQSAAYKFSLAEDDTICAVSDSVTRRIEVYKYPPTDLGSDTIICDGDTIVLNAQCNNCTYKWQDNSGNSSFQVTQPGIYYVEATKKGECSSTDTIEITNCFTGINNENHFSFKMFPNPSSGKISLEFRQRITGDMTITDIHGRVVFRQSIDNDERINLVLDDQIKNGMYFVRIDYEKGIYTERVILNK